MRGDGISTLRFGLFGAALVIITQRAQDQGDLNFQANHDDLTAPVNRRRIFAAVTQAMAGATNAHRPPTAMLYCDLDDFKPINDRLGHDADDDVLRCTARRIAATLRQHDVVARIGGDEFLAYRPDVNEAAASMLRERVEDALHTPIDWNGTTLQVGATVGIAVSGPGRYSSPDELIAAADEAMYARKNARKEARDASASALGTMALGVRRDRHVPPVHHGYPAVQALNIVDSATTPPTAVR